MNREQGGVLPMMLALLAAMAVAATVTARHGLHDHRLARRSYLRAVAHNLAEATIVAGRLGQTIPDAALNQGLSGTGLRATTRLVRGPLPGGQQRRAATTELQPGGLRYQIEVVTRRGPGGRIDTLVWHERQLD